MATTRRLQRIGAAGLLATLGATAVLALTDAHADATASTTAATVPATTSVTTASSGGGGAATSSAAASGAAATPSSTATAPPSASASPSPTGSVAAAAIHTNTIATPAITQQYSLDCESAALQAALAARGTTVTQDWILSVMGADPRAAVLDASGNVVQWGNPFTTFVGNVNGSEPAATGYGVYYGPIAAAAQAAGHTVVAGTGISATTVYEALSDGYPVVIWTDTTFTAVPTSTWTAWDGTTVPYAVGEHAVTLTGIDVANQTVTLLDVEFGTFRTFSMAQFTSFWSTFGNMAVIVK
ncbi:MAG TPA: C39 family peptidase [Candidatus Dormibacteraeota bacterium]|jgi:uncharacterized protein YvpB|nr:C39 family peptidase [Candidatus Dormibacteraeota bacterium]